jgi:GNAT superfamily N-acetyltransferase
MMDIEVRRAAFPEVEGLRALYRQEANCQIIHDSALARGIADPYLCLIDGRIAGYGGVWNKYHDDQLMEFYTLPAVRRLALPMFRALLAVSGATRIEAQTNMPLLLLMLYDCTQNITSEAVLFRDAETTHLACPGGILRATTPGDTGRIFAHQHEPIGDWLIEVDGLVVATGGAYDHYNPPYSDIFMEVTPSHRGLGYGSYLVQELKRLCYERGKVPAARCHDANVASRQTLQRAGFLPCARLLVGEVIVDTSG